MVAGLYRWEGKLKVKERRRQGRAAQAFSKSARVAATKGVGSLTTLQRPSSDSPSATNTNKDSIQFNFKATSDSVSNSISSFTVTQRTIHSEQDSSVLQDAKITRSINTVTTFMIAVNCYWRHLEPLQDDSG
jgi:hypothetical protein